MSSVLYVQGAAFSPSVCSGRSFGLCPPVGAECKRIAKSEAGVKGELLGGRGGAEPHRPTP